MKRHLRTRRDRYRGRAARTREVERIAHRIDPDPVDAPDGPYPDATTDVGSTAAAGLEGPTARVEAGKPA